MSKIFLTSDTHFNHSKIISLDGRPFKHVKEMEDGLIENWNSTVSSGDTVYHLGDFCFGNREYAEGILRRLNGQKILIIGNHDSKSVINSKLWNHKSHYNEISYKNKKICMSHYPFLTWNSIGRGSLMAHGHCHGNIPDEEKGAYGKITDVGVMNFDYKPLFIDDFIDITDSKELRTIDYH